MASSASMTSSNNSIMADREFQSDPNFEQAIRLRKGWVERDYVEPGHISTDQFGEETRTKALSVSCQQFSWQ
jgi:hypothetical protein